MKCPLCHAELVEGKRINKYGGLVHGWFHPAGNPDACPLATEFTSLAELQQHEREINERRSATSGRG